MRGLCHDGLPGFEAEIEDADSLYVLRQYADGIPLTLYMEERGGRLGKSQAVDIALQLCDILAYLHSQPIPIIHRDVKPSNIIINTDENQRVKLIDFGISRRFSKDADTDTTYYAIGDCSFAVTADGDLWAWGDNAEGQLGVGSTWGAYERGGWHGEYYAIWTYPIKVMEYVESS